MTLPFPGFPPDGETIGIERARQLVAYTKPLMPAIMAEVEAWLRSEQSKPIERSAVPASKLAQIVMHPAMRGIGLGSVWAGRGGNASIVTVTLLRDGSVTWKAVRSVRRLT